MLMMMLWYEDDRSKACGWLEVATQSHCSKPNTTTKIQSKTNESYQSHYRGAQFLILEASDV